MSSSQWRLIRLGGNPKHPTRLMVNRPPLLYPPPLVPIGNQMLPSSCLPAAHLKEAKAQIRRPPTTCLAKVGQKGRLEQGPALLGSTALIKFSILVVQIGFWGTWLAPYILTSIISCLKHFPSSYFLGRRRIP